MNYKKYNFKATLLREAKINNWQINGLQKQNFKVALFQEETKQKLTIDRNFKIMLQNDRKEQKYNFKATRSKN